MEAQINRCEKITFFKFLTLDGNQTSLFTGTGRRPHARITRNILMMEIHPVGRAALVAHHFFLAKHEACTSANSCILLMTYL